MRVRELFFLLIRYIFLVAVSFPDLRLIYAIFTPITIYPLFWIIKMLDPVSSLLNNNLLLFKGNFIEIIPACIAGAAYFLLLILNLSTPMHPIKRAKSLIFLCLSFLVLNIIRIVIFSLLFIEGYKYFDITHQLVWHFGSTIMIVLLWFANVWLFDIRAIPIYTDIKHIFMDIVPSPEKEKEKSKKVLKRKVSKILNSIENKEKHDYKNIKKEMASLKTKKL